MKVSIITVAYNSAKTIEDTIQSVIGQTYPEIEYIIIDGNSKDETLKIAEKYRSNISKIVSEKDRGIYDAMNKGVKLATGDVVGILNSDDFYISSSVIEEVVKKIKETNADCVWGDLVYVDQKNTGKITRYWQGGEYSVGKFKKGWHPPHPAFFVKKVVYEKYGIFREDLGISADYELMLRFLEKYKISSAYIPKVLVKMRDGGSSNWRNIKSVIKGNLQSYKAWKINGLPASPMIVLRKPLGKARQILKKI